MPTDVPLVIQLPGNRGAQPKDTQLIQLGFNQSLNYDFVARHQTTIQQMFAFIPLGIAYGLSIDTANVTMHALQAYNTIEELGYVTCLALAYIPSSLVNQLSLDVRTAVSTLYSNPDGSVNAMMSMINPSIPILAGPALNGPGGYGNGGVGSQGQGGGSNLGNQDGSQDAQTRGTSVGIGVGVVCGAAVYGAAMFYVARRYKRRKQGHNRSSSIQHGDSLSRNSYLAGEAMMSGARGGYTDRRDSDSSGGSSSHGHSATSHARQAGISRPIMAENSLGWR